MVMEYCNIGSLEDYLQEQGCSTAQGTRESVDSVRILPKCLDIYSRQFQVQIPIDIGELLSFGYQIANGMAYLNSRTVKRLEFKSKTAHFLGHSP